VCVCVVRRAAWRWVDLYTGRTCVKRNARFVIQIIMLDRDSWVGQIPTNVSTALSPLSPLNTHRESSYGIIGMYLLYDNITLQSSVLQRKIWLCRLQHHHHHHYHPKIVTIMSIIFGGAGGRPEYNVYCFYRYY
jgi:hypothetical protein